MPTGIYERNDAHLAILEKARSCIARGPLSLETKAKISAANTRRITVKCDYCGKEIKRKPSHYNRRKRHFCSRNCYSSFRKELLPKEEQNSYGHGLSIEERETHKRARSITNHAIRDGLLVRKPCEICGELAEAHHYDYSKPLEVRWLCRLHHWQVHHNNPELLGGGLNG